MLLHCHAFFLVRDRPMYQTKQMLLIKSEHRIPGQTKPSYVSKYVYKLKRCQSSVTAHDYVYTIVYHPVIQHSN